MKYLLLGYLLWPVFRLLRGLFPVHPGRRLIIQTAKIGDWINTTPLIRQLAPVDVVFAPILEPLVSHDQFIQSGFPLPGRCILGYKLRLAGRLWQRGYEEIFILMPNMPNTLLARLACARRTATLDTYRTGTLLRWLGAGFVRREHRRDTLVLDDYLQLAGIAPDGETRRKHATAPLHEPAVRRVAIDADFRVGISLTAGNPLKTMPSALWQRLVVCLLEAGARIHVFGTAAERPYLDALQSGLPPEAMLVDCLGSLPLEALPWHIAQMHLYLSTDTGNSYIADALGVPVINFAGPCDMAEQRPLGDRVLIVETKGLVPFSFIFSAPCQTDKTAEMLYAVDDAQFEEIRTFIADCRTAARGARLSI